MSASRALDVEETIRDLVIPGLGQVRDHITVQDPEVLDKLATAIRLLEGYVEPEPDQREAGNALRQTLFHVRRTVTNAIRVGDAGLDLVRFLELVHEARVEIGRVEVALSTVLATKQAQEPNGDAGS